VKDEAESEMDGGATSVVIQCLTYVGERWPVCESSIMIAAKQEENISQASIILDIYILVSGDHADKACIRACDKV